jgi:peroxiredoxin
MNDIVEMFLNPYTFDFSFLFQFLEFGLKVAEKYSAIQNILGKKIIHRTVVLIDQQGIIRYYHRGMPSPKEIIAAAQTV